MDLTTVARVKALLFKENASETTHDALLGTLVTNVSARVATALGRHVEIGTFVEEYEIRRGSKVVTLRGAPVTAITSMTYSYLPQDADAEELTENTEFRLDAASGGIRLLFSPTSHNPGYLNVSYTGGMAANTAGFIAAYPDLAGAIDSQVSYEFQRSSHPGSNSTTRDGTTSFTGQVNLLDALLDVIDCYSRGAV